MTRKIARFPSTCAPDVGPMLAEMLRAHADDERAVSYPDLESHAEALSSLCKELDDPTLWPVGDAAERLAGAASLLSAGRVRVRGWSYPVDERVLLVAVAAVSPLPLVVAAQHARASGAKTIHACGVRVDGLDPTTTMTAFESYQLI